MSPMKRRGRLTRNKKDVLEMMPIVLRRVREATGLSQVSIAQKTQSVRQSVAQWEIGRATPNDRQFDLWVEIICDRIAELRNYERIGEIVREMQMKPITIAKE